MSKKIIIPYRYGDIVEATEEVKSLLKKGDRAFVIVYDFVFLSDNTFDFDYKLIREKDKQFIAWVGHDSLKLVKEGDESTIKEYGRFAIDEDEEED